jgi:oxalate decarboxylase/phosphoglucose isomerase-like protein (cupin superfamily)
MTIKKKGESSMDKIKVVRFEDVEPDTLLGDAGGGYMKRIIYPHLVAAKGFAFGFAEVPPGKSLHPWHNHAGYKAKGLEVVYAPGFEELYFIIKGSGVVQWKEPDGEVKEKSVGERDTILFCEGVPEHQVLNTGNENMLLTYIGCPPTKIIKDA